MRPPNGGRNEANSGMVRVWVRVRDRVRVTVRVRVRVRVRHPMADLRYGRPSLWRTGISKLLVDRLGKYESMNVTCMFV